MMTDTLTPEKRSWVMSQIRGKNTGIEDKVKRLLILSKIKFKQHPQILGSPDFLVGKKTLVFCDGDFWHGYRYETRKKPRKKFWKDKIEGNMRRDKRISRRLRGEGYSVIRLWEHDINDRPLVCLNRIVRFMR